MPESRGQMNAPCRSSGITIRRARCADAEALALVGAATFLESFAGVLDGDDIVMHCREQHSAEKYRGWLESERTQIWVAETDRGGAIVGYVMLSPPELPLADLQPTDLEVKRIYVLQRFQGEGVGGRLMQTAAAAARDRGAARLLLGVYSRNEQALGFYARQGFSRVGERQFRVGRTDHYDYILARTL